MLDAVSPHSPDSIHMGHRGDEERRNGHWIIKKPQRPVDSVTWCFPWKDDLERVMGIEPTLEAWEAAVLPLNYTRSGVVPVAQSQSRGGDYSAGISLPGAMAARLFGRHAKYVPNLVRLGDTRRPSLPLQFGL